MRNLQISPGSLFANRFEIQRAAGSGGMGTVYRTTDRYSGDTVALKLLHPASGVGGADEGERFVREAQLLAELRHPGIVAHVAHGQTPDGQRFLAMEWLEGQDLGERLAQGPLPARDCLRLLEQVANALSVAHQRGIIHRDLKPTNLFLVGGDVGRVKILDFGIARRIATSQAMTRTGMVVGTPEYMAPEQARGCRDLTPAADLFSLGCVLYECLTGQPPFVADHIAAVLVQILFEEPIPIEDRRPGIPAALSGLLGRLLNKDRAQRVADAAALRAELLSLGELPEPGPAVTIASPRTESFAAQEQSLFSIVLAAPAEEEIGLNATQPASAVRLGTTDRQALWQALAGLGGSPDLLANGTLIVTVPPLGSAQDQATLAARAALLIKERWPEAVVSMATGRGAAHGQMPMGEVVELAARSLKRESSLSFGSPATGVRIDPLSAKLLAGRFAQTAQPGGVLLLYEERDVDASRPLLGKPTPCVGREAELSTLESQLTACIEEQEARVMLVTAPPGAGKSRLRHEFLRRIEKRTEPITVILGRGDLMSAGAPYGILSAAIRRLCGLTGSETLETQRQALQARIGKYVAGAAQERIILFIGELCNIPFSADGNPMLMAARQEPKLMRDSLRRAFLDWLAAECAFAPLLLILDDLQWGDELSVSVLDEALRSLTGAPLFVLALARPELHKTFPNLWQVHKVHELPLKGLSKKACERLVQQVLGKDVAPETVARAVEQAGGNALFLEELIRSISEGKSEDQPETVLAMLQVRISRLDVGPRKVVRAAAVFGQSFWSDGVASILGFPRHSPDIDAWLLSATAAELIQPQASSRLAEHNEYGFRHALIRDAAYSLLGASDLTTGHRLAGEFLEAAGEHDTAVIAEHFERSGDKKRAARGYMQAAENSLARGNHIGALRHAERGLACDPQGELLGQLRSVESYAAFFLNQYERMGRAAEVVMENVKAGSLAWCRAMAPAIQAALNQRNMDRGFALISRALGAEPDEDARAVYSDALSYIFAICTVSATTPVVEAILGRQASNVTHAAATNRALGRYLHMCRGTLAIGRWPGAWTLVRECERAIELSNEAGDLRFALIVRGSVLEWGWLDLGDVEGARQRMAALETQMDQSQDVILVALWRHLLARILCAGLDEASWSQAEQLVKPLLAPDEGGVTFRVAAQGIMARVALLRGRWHEAAEQAGAAMRLFSALPAWLSHTAPVYIRALMGLGALAEATTVAEQVLETIPMLGQLGVAEIDFRLAASEAFHGAGQRDRALTELEATLHQIKIRADEIPDPIWKSSYLTRNSHCVRAQQLATEWGMVVVVK